jgi:DnaK suppressor protein
LQHNDFFAAPMHRIVLVWKQDILKELKETLQLLRDGNENHPDFTDRASSETDRAVELRARDRQRKLIAKIDAALTRIENGTYGYCDETGEPISLKRPAGLVATLSSGRRRNWLASAKTSTVSSVNTL